MRRIESVKLYIVTCVSICNGRLKEHVIQWAVVEPLPASARDSEIRVPLVAPNLVAANHVTLPMSMAPTTLEEPVAIRANPQPRIERTALEKALSLTDVDMVRRAIANGADVNLPFSDALTPLCRAAAVGERRILKQLLLAKADVDRTAKRVSEPGAESPDPSSVAGHVVDAGFGALHWAAREGRIECARLLLEAQATVDVRAADDVTPFMLACKGGHIECAKLLLRAGADIEAANVRGGTALVVACVMGHAETVRELLTMRANADALTVAIDDSEQLFQCRPLVTACRYNKPQCVSLLLNAGVGVEAMTTALTELEAFPSFKECQRLVKRALERKQQRLKARGHEAPAAATVDPAEAAEAAEAAMAALLAEEERKPSGSATAAAKKRRKAKKRAAAAAEVAAEAEAEEDVEAEGAEAVASLPGSKTETPDLRIEADAGVLRVSDRARVHRVSNMSVSNMNALAAEYQQYQDSASGASERMDDKMDLESKENSVVRDRRMEDEASSDSHSPCGSHASRSPVKESPEIEAVERDYEQLDRILQTNDSLSQLDLFLHRKKFTADAMGFLLSKVRDSKQSVVRVRGASRPESKPEPPTEKAALKPCLGAAPEAATEEADAIASAAGAGASDKRSFGGAQPRPPPLSTPREPLTEEVRRRRKARRAPPPPGCMMSPNMMSSSASRPPPRTASFEELERRLELELEAAREREAALEAALKQRSDALSELVVCPITHEPMVDPVSAADGQTYERRAIEEWLTKAGSVPISPMTGETLKDTTLRPNFLARALPAL